ncbi:hypothetical protein E4U61_007418, partial [Claviceps capensis]
AGVHDLALATVSNDGQDLGKVAAEDDRDTAKEDVVVRAAQVDQQTVDGLETALGARSSVAAPADHATCVVVQSQAGAGRPNWARVKEANTKCAPPLRVAARFHQFCLTT